MVVHRHNAKIAKKAENAENAGTAKNLPKQELDHRRAKSGWAAVLPPGGLQSVGHRRCANGMLDSFQTGSVQSQLATLDILSRNST